MIIPARGSTPWLELSLTSIALQSFQASDIILIDDGLAHVNSIKELGQKLFGHRFRLLKNEGQGISAALNTGIQQSGAHWIARMDADDIAHPNRFKMQLDFLSQQSPGVIGCGTQVRFINSKGTVLGHSHLPTPAWPQIRAQHHRKDMLCALFSTNEERGSSRHPPTARAWTGQKTWTSFSALPKRGEFSNLDALPPGLSPASNPREFSCAGAAYGGPRTGFSVSLN